MSSTSSAVATPYGPGRLTVHPAAEPFVTLLLSHGAGNGMEARDLAALAASLPPHGVSVVGFDQPWRVAGRKVATAPPTLDLGLQAAVQALPTGSTPLVVGGRSAGARSAARTASSVGAIGCLALAFPLHPPGRPEKSRISELTESQVTTLVIQGERDPMGRPEEFPPGTPMCVVPGGDHGFKVPARGALSQAEALEVIVEATLEWLVREAAG